MFAVDVSIDQLDWKLRQDQRVTTVERNARYLRTDDIPEAPRLVTMDVSFISVGEGIAGGRTCRCSWQRFFDSHQAAIRTGEKEIGKGGIVRDRCCTRKLSSA